VDAAEAAAVKVKAADEAANEFRQFAGSKHLNEKGGRMDRPSFF
jgi:hypothetical protein